MQKLSLLTLGVALLVVALVTFPQNASAQSYDCTDVRLGEWLEAPYRPYSCRRAGDYVEQFKDGTPGFDPNWLQNREQVEGRMLPGYVYEPRCDCYVLASTPGPYRRVPVRSNLFYRRAMKRGAAAFNTFGNYGRYLNGQFDFDGNRLKSIR